MNDTELDNENKSPKKEPIFIERGDGLGWTFNFNRPISFVILVAFLGFVVVVLLFIEGVIKF